MAKLHEILAVEDSVAKAANALIEESKKTFAKENLFKGQVRRLEMFAEEDQNQNIEEHTKLETTVGENLEYLVKPLSDYWDTILQKDLGNQEAKANVILDNGDLLMDEVPAVWLLAMEGKLAKLRELYMAIPTLEPGYRWAPDEIERTGVYVMQDQPVAFKTKKDIEARVLYAATKEHPAQVKEVAVDKNVGKYTSTIWSGKIPSVEKAEILSRLDQVIRAVKQARMRANEQKVPAFHVAADLLHYIHTGIL
jgi:hypothetical protein